MDRIKSALEIAMEKASTVRVDAAKLQELEYLPEGKVLGARYLGNGDINLKEELLKYQPEVRSYVLQGLVDTFLSNLSLPRDEAAAQTNRRCQEGLMLIKKDRAALKQVFKEMEVLFQYYGSSLQQAYLNLKEDFTARLAQAQRMGGTQIARYPNFHVERLPEFQQEWFRVQSQINSQYERLLEEKRQSIRSIA